MAWPSRETTCTSANFYTYLVPTYCFNECIFTIKFIEIIKQKITRGIIHNTVMGPNSLTHTHRHRAYILDSFRTKPTAPATNLALPLIYCALNAANKKPNRAHAIHFSAANIRSRPNCDSFREIFLVRLLMAVGTFKNTPNFHVCSPTLPFQLTLAKYVNIIVQLIVPQRNECEIKIRYNGFKWSGEKNGGKTYLLVRFRQCVQNYFLIVASDGCCCCDCCCANQSHSITENRIFCIARNKEINGSEQKPFDIDRYGGKWRGKMRYRWKTEAAESSFSSTQSHMIKLFVTFHNHVKQFK